jgi:hypothetical protein
MSTWGVHPAKVHLRDVWYTQNKYSITLHPKWINEIYKQSHIYRYIDWEYREFPYTPVVYRNTIYHSITSYYYLSSLWYICDKCWTNTDTLLTKVYDLHDGSLLGQLCDFWKMQDALCQPLQYYTESYSLYFAIHVSSFLSKAKWLVLVPECWRKLGKEV